MPCILSLSWRPSSSNFFEWRVATRDTVLCSCIDVIKHFICFVLGSWCSRLSVDRASVPTLRWMTSGLKSPLAVSQFSPLFYAKLIVHRAVLLFIFLNFVRTNSQSSKQLPVQIHEQSPIVIAPSASVCDELTSFFFLPATLRSRMFIEKLKTLPFCYPVLPADLFS